MHALIEFHREERLTLPPLGSEVSEIQQVERDKKAMNSKSSSQRSFVRPSRLAFATALR